jgi:hypothetical protein
MWQESWRCSCRPSHPCAARRIWSKAIVARTADPISYATCGGAPGGLPNSGYGWGIVNAQRAIESLGQTGTLRGVVTDASTGLALAGASVTVFALGGSVPLTTVVTDAEGRYDVPIAWGSYRVAVELPGYVPIAASPVYVVGGQTTTQNMTFHKLYLPMICASL